MPLANLTQHPVLPVDHQIPVVSLQLELNMTALSPIVIPSTWYLEGKVISSSWEGLETYMHGQ